MLETKGDYISFSFLPLYRQLDDASSSSSKRVDKNATQHAAILPPLNPYVTNFQGHFSRYLSPILLALLLSFTSHSRWYMSCLSSEQPHGSHALSCVPKMFFLNISYALTRCQIWAHSNWILTPFPLCWLMYGQIYCMYCPFCNFFAHCIVIFGFQAARMSINTCICILYCVWSCVICVPVWHNKQRQRWRQTAGNCWVQFRSEISDSGYRGIKRSRWQT